MLPEPRPGLALKPYQGFGTLPAANVGVRRGHLWTVDHLACLLQGAQLSRGACMGPPPISEATPPVALPVRSRGVRRGNKALRAGVPAT